MSEGVTFAIAPGVVLAVDLWKSRVRIMQLLLRIECTGVHRQLSSI